MVEYRAYIVGDDGHFVGFEGFVCVDDPEAIDKAKRLVNGHDVELWNGARLVIRLQHTSDEYRAFGSPINPVPANVKRREGPPLFRHA
jgi:hypothetical protein